MDIFIIVIVVLLLIGLAISILIFGFLGALAQFAWAAESGFIGVIIFVAAWVFLFPVMAIWAVIWGFITTLQLK